MVRRTVVGLTMALVLLARAGHAQTVAIAQISGVVSDESNAALPGVEVQVTQTATGAASTSSPTCRSVPTSSKRNCRASPPTNEPASRLLSVPARW